MKENKKDGNLIHVYPVSDLDDHKIKGTDCPCHPAFDFEYGIVIHHAFDFREFYEFLRDQGG